MNASMSVFSFLQTQRTNGAMRAVATAAVAFLVLLCAQVATAALTARDWRTAGDSLLTLDTVTGLQWLDVTVTQGSSWNSVNADLLPGGRLAAFRRPTDAEIATFWTDAGIPDIERGGSFNATAANLQPVKALQQLWGETGIPFGIQDATAATLVTSAESFDPVDNSVEGTAFLRVFDNQGTAAAQLRVLLGSPPTQGFSFVAHALVQGSPNPAIPEPATLILFTIGIVAGAAMRARGRTRVPSQLKGQSL